MPENVGIWELIQLSPSCQEKFASQKQIHKTRINVKKKKKKNRGEKIKELPK